MKNIHVLDLMGVIYSSGKVFNGLSTGRLDTENFVRGNITDGIRSKPDLDLLKDLVDVATFVIEHHEGAQLDAAFVRALNTQISRSGALEPGELRAAEPAIGVTTRYGRHEPPALSMDELAELVSHALRHGDVIEAALTLFVDLARAQPFSDGNKRTAIFAANALLLRHNVDLMLTVPYDENDPSLADSFNDQLAKAYVFGEDDGVKSLMREYGLKTIPQQWGAGEYRGGIAQTPAVSPDIDSPSVPPRPRF